MYLITKNEYCTMCRKRFYGHGSGKNKRLASQMALSDAITNLYLHLKENKFCGEEFKMYEKNLKDYLRPKWITSIVNIFNT